MLIHTFCKIFEHEIVLQKCNSKQKQYQVHNSYKTGELSNKLSYCFGKIEENMDLSHIYLPVWTGLSEARKMLGGENKVSLCVREIS